MKSILRLFRKTPTETKYLCSFPWKDGAAKYKISVCQKVILETDQIKEIFAFVGKHKVWFDVKTYIETGKLVLDQKKCKSLKSILQ
jgi:hypothetical protein